MELAALIVLIAALITAFVMFWSSPQARVSRRRVKAKKTRTTVSRQHSLYESVSVVCAPNACEAAQALAEKRFLSSEAPIFPLSNCSSSTCSCKYAHYDDRRSNSGGRRALASVRADMFEQSGRKDRRDESRRCRRRRSDWGFV